MVLNVYVYRGVASDSSIQHEPHTMLRGVSSADVAPTLTPPAMVFSVIAERSYVQPAMSCVPDEPVRATNIVLSGHSGGQFCPDRNLVCVCRVSNAVRSGGEVEVSRYPCVITTLASGEYL